MFGFIDTQQENRVIMNHFRLIFNFNVYKSRDLKTLIFLRLKADIIKIRHIVKNVKIIFKKRESISKNGGN